MKQMCLRACLARLFELKWIPFLFKEVKNLFDKNINEKGEPLTKLFFFIDGWKCTLQLYERVHFHPLYGVFSFF